MNIVAWWAELDATTQVFCTIGLISNVLFLIYVAIQLLGHNIDLEDMATDHEGGLPFTILSIRGLLAFGMFLGYAAGAVYQSGFGLVSALIVGVFSGLLASWLAYKLLLLLLQLQSSGTLELENAVGKTATVHLSLPEKGTAHGKVMIELQGALREMDAISEGNALPTGTPVLVTEVNEQGHLVVVPFNTENKTPETISW
jgi:uncharacterized membrane protein YeaQ/YmgE (transglycosylase-associated protein family)